MSETEAIAEMKKRYVTLGLIYLATIPGTTNADAARLAIAANDLYAARWVTTNHP